MRCFRIVAVGDANSCTTEVLTAFAHGQWPQYYLPTSFEPFNTECKYVVYTGDPAKCIA